MSGLQLRRGNSTTLAAITGDPGEPLFDTTTNTLYVSNGSAPQHIGGPKRTEFAYCRSDDNNDCATATEIQLQWSTSNTVISSSDWFTATANGLRALKTGTYLVQASITSYVYGADDKGLEIRFSIGGISETPIFYSYQDGAWRRGSSASMLAILELDAGDIVGVRCRGIVGTTGTVRVEADDSALTMTLLKEG